MVRLNVVVGSVLLDVVNEWLPEDVEELNVRSDSARSRRQGLFQDPTRPVDPLPAPW